MLILFSLVFHSLRHRIHTIYMRLSRHVVYNVIIMNSSLWSMEYQSTIHSFSVNKNQNIQNIKKRKKKKVVFILTFSFNQIINPSIYISHFMVVRSKFSLFFLTSVLAIQISSTAGYAKHLNDFLIVGRHLSE